MSVLNNEPIQAQTTETTPASEPVQAAAGQENQQPQVPTYLPKEMQNDERLKKFLKPTELAKAYIDLQDRSQRMVVRPDEKASDEEKAAWRTAIGVPATPDEYEIPEEVNGVKIDKDRANDLKKLAHQAGIPKDAVKAFVEWDAKTNAQEMAALEAAGKKAVETATEQLKQEWGTGFNENTTIAKRFYESAFSKETATKLRALGMENDVGFIRELYALAKRAGAVEGSLVDGPKVKPRTRTVVDYSRVG